MLNYKIPLLIIFSYCNFFFSSSNADSYKTLKVGVILPLSGPVAEYGVAAKNGFENAQSENPNKYSKIEFIFEDSQYDSKKTISSYQKLRNFDQVDIFYVWGFGPSQAVVPLAENDKLPLFAVSAERSISIGKKYTLRHCYYIEMIADALLKRLRKQNLKKLGIVKVELAYMNGLISALKTKMHEDESIELAAAYQLDDSDFKNTILKLKNSNFDAIGVFLVPGQIVQYYKQAKSLAFTSKTFGTDFFDSTKIVTDAAGTMESAEFAAPYASKEFVQKYTGKYGNDVQVAWAAMSYEFAEQTAKLFYNGLAADKNSDSIIAKYTADKTQQGSTTSYTYVESSLGSGFDFKVTNRKIINNLISTIVEESL